MVFQLFRLCVTTENLCFFVSSESFRKASLRSPHWWEHWVPVEHFKLQKKKKKKKQKPSSSPKIKK